MCDLFRWDTIEDTPMKRKYHGTIVNSIQQMQIQIQLKVN